MLEAEFLGYSEKENQELEALLREVGVPIESHDIEEDEGELVAKLDDKKILDVLQRDLSAFQSRD